MSPSSSGNRDQTSWAELLVPIWMTLLINFGGWIAVLVVIYAQNDNVPGAFTQMLQIHSKVTVYCKIVGLSSHPAKIVLQTTISKCLVINFYL